MNLYLHLLSLLLLMAITCYAYDTDDDTVSETVSVSIKRRTISGTLVINEEKITGQRVVLSAVDEKTGQNKIAYKFYGIPYAAAPVDSLRFKKPQKLDESRGLTKSQNFFFKACPQAETPTLKKTHMEEDCLFLNVFTPRKKEFDSPYKQLPVVIYIHDGGFLTGSALPREGPLTTESNAWLENYVARGIVIVTIQYRLDILGFMSDGSPELPGNLGIWDQIAALKWIYSNIKFFGGNSNNITIWGAGAGAASAGLLSASKESRNLFHKTIQTSGSAFSGWVLNDQVIQTSLEAASRLSSGTERGSRVPTNIQQIKNFCKDLRGHDLWQCLVNVEIEDIMMEIQRHKYEGKWQFSPFHPRLDGILFDEPLRELIKSGPVKHTIISFAKDDGLLLTYQRLTSWQMKEHKIQGFGTYEFSEFVHNNIKATSDDFDLDALHDSLIKFYAWGNPQRIGFEDYTMFVSDVLFILPAILEAREKDEADWPVHLYELAYVHGGHPRGTIFYGVPHNYELKYMKDEAGENGWQADEKCLREYFIEGITTFVHTGFPKDQGRRWPSMRQESPCEKSWKEQLECISLGSPWMNKKMTSKEGSSSRCNPEMVKRWQFWVNLSKKFDLTKIEGLPYSNIFNVGKSEAMESKGSAPTKSVEHIPRGIFTNRKAEYLTEVARHAP